MKNLAKLPIPIEKSLEYTFEKEALNKIKEVLSLSFLENSNELSNIFKEIINFKKKYNRLRHLVQESLHTRAKIYAEVLSIKLHTLENINSQLLHLILKLEQEGYLSVTTEESQEAELSLNEPFEIGNINTNKKKWRQSNKNAPIPHIIHHTKQQEMCSFILSIRQQLSALIKELDECLVIMDQEEDPQKMVNEFYKFTSEKILFTYKTPE